MKAIIVKNSRVPKMLSWFMEVGGITLFPFIFIRGEGNPTLIRHESIAWDFLYGFAKYKNYDQAYRSIRFEQEAYGNASEENYLEVRKNFAWLKYKV